MRSEGYSSWSVCVSVCLSVHDYSDWIPKLKSVHTELELGTKIKKCVYIPK